MPPATATRRPRPPIVVIFGDEEYAKSRALRGVLDRILPPGVDRGMALCEYDGSKPEEQGGPACAAVLDDLRTLPFLADCRVVLIRDADRFIAACRDRLERYLAAPAPTGVLILLCRSLPRNTRLCKAASAAGGELHECRKLTPRAAIDFLIQEAQARHKRLEPAAASRIAALVGPAQGLLASEVEKLSLYVGNRPAITVDDVADLVGLSREERIFGVMEAAGVGRLDQALHLWSDVLATDPSGVYKAVGGIAFVLRRWLAAHELLAAGQTVRSIAPQMMMWGRERELETLLSRLPPRRCKQLLAALAELDAQAKSGLRSIESGVASLLVQVASPAA